MSSDKGPGDGSHNDSYVRPTMAIREVCDYTSNIVGKVKTIIDASVTDPKQNKAVKDLIHNAIWNDSYITVLHWAQRVCEPKDPKLAKQKEWFPYGSGSTVLPGDVDKE